MPLSFYLLGGLIAALAVVGVVEYIRMRENQRIARENRNRQPSFSARQERIAKMRRGEPIFNTTRTTDDAATTPVLVMGDTSLERIDVPADDAPWSGGGGSSGGGGASASWDAPSPDPEPARYDFSNVSSGSSSSYDSGSSSTPDFSNVDSGSSSSSSSD